MSFESHPLTLAFRDRSLEEAYRAGWIGKMLLPIRIGLAVILLIQVVGFFSDSSWLPRQQDYLHLVWSRLATSALVLLVFATTLSARGRAWMREIVLGMVIAYALIISARVVALPPSALGRFSATFIVVTLVACTLLHLGFARSLVAVVALTAGFHFVVLRAGGGIPSEKRDLFVYYFVAGVCLVASRVSDRQDRMVFVESLLLARERERSEGLLRNMLPGPIAERLKRGGTIADHVPQAGVLFADVVGFTTLAEKLSPDEVVRRLDLLFGRFDELTEEHGLEKIKTIGDAYMAASGLLDATDDHLARLARAALAMRAAATQIETSMQLRIGMHVGPVVAGVIGKRRYFYDLWGDTVNTASRMESHGSPGEIHVTEACRVALPEGFVLEERGVVDIKGKGPMRTWWLRGERS